MNDPLKHFKIVYSPLSEEIYLARMHAKRPQTTLHKKPILPGILYALTRKMMTGAPNGSSMEYTIDGETYYRITIEPVEKPSGADL